MSNLLNWALSQTFGSNYRTELSALVEGLIASNPSYSLAEVQAEADAKAFDLFNAAAAKLPGYAKTFVEYILTLEQSQIDAIINTDVSDLYNAALAKIAPTASEGEAVSQG